MEAASGESTPDLNKIKFLQINLNHTKTATQLVAQYALQNNLDILLLQDPYVYNTNLLGFPQNWRYYHSTNLKAWIIIINPRLLITPIAPNFSSIFIYLNQHPHLIVVGSQYISPTADLRLGVEEWSDKFNSTFKNCNFTKGKHARISGQIRKSISPPKNK
jgi:hypothetical protein